MEELKGKTLKVGREGYVQLIDFMGEDTTPAKIARVSYGEERKKREDDALVNYLYEHGHMSPFEFVEVVFRVKAPIFVARQWFRHRTGSYAERSGRYSTLDFGAWTPEEVRFEQNGKGSPNETAAREIFDEYASRPFISYNLLRTLGVVREQARAVVPLATYTLFYYKSDMRNLLNFLRLRLSKHAQPEIAEYAAAIGAFLKILYPNIWENFLNELNTIRLDKDERTLLKLALQAGLNFSDKKEFKNQALALIDDASSQFSWRFVNSKSKRKNAINRVFTAVNGGNTDDYNFAVKLVSNYDI